MEGSLDRSSTVNGTGAHRSAGAALVLALVALLSVVPALLPTAAPAATAAPPGRTANTTTNPSGWDCSTTKFAPALASDTLSGVPVTPQPDERGRWVPVIFVHGWTSSSTHDANGAGAFSAKIDLTANALGRAPGERSLIGQIQTIPGAATFTFDYHDTSGSWVDDPSIGPALGTAIDCLFDKSGGEKVIVVAHSMGGLATRYALGEDARRPDKVSTVVTFGTPNTGSVAARVTSVGADAAAVTQVGAGIRILLAACGRASTVSMNGTGPCGNVVGAFDGDAGRALRAGSRELDALAPYPRNVAVHGLAGEASFDVLGRSWFGLQVPANDVAGDVIVMPDSAKAQSTASGAVRCRYQMNVAQAGLDVAGLLAGTTSVTEVSDHPLDVFSGPCYHGNLMRGIELTNTATGAIDDDITSRIGSSPGTASSQTYSPADGYRPTIVVMDTSGSMSSAAPDGRTRIDAARASVLNLVKELPPGSPFGLIAYPGTGKKVDGCSIGNVEIAPGPLDVAATSAAVRRFTPDGDTPTGPALKHAAEKLRTLGEQGTIILVSDGESNCGAVPVCETTKQLAADGINVRINTVGLNIDRGGRDELRCVAEAGGGRYVDAQNSDELRDAISDATSPKLTIAADVPGRLPRVSGTGTGGATIAVTITNTGRVRAEDVRVSLDFQDRSGTPGAIQVPRPVRFLGNLEPGESRPTEFVVRPDASLGGAFTWTMTATARGGVPATADGSVVLDDPFGAMTGLLGHVRTVAVLGDSYSSGEGIGTYSEGTDGDGNNCHRSDDAYGPMLAGAENTTMIACSGAVTADFYGQQHSGDAAMAPQLQQLRALATGKDSPDAVLLSIGGNDVGFGDEVVACTITAFCGLTGFTGDPLGKTLAGAVGYTDRMDRIAAIGNDLRRVYRDVDRAVNDADARRERGDRFAPIVVVPYPRITPDVASIAAGAGAGNPYAGCQAFISPTELTHFNGFLDALNLQIEAAVADLQREHIPVYYAADVVPAFQPNHTVCDGTESYSVIAADAAALGARVVGLQNKSELLHPNRDGHAAMARAISAWAATTAAIPEPAAPLWKSDSVTRMNGVLQKVGQWLWPFSAADIYQAGGDVEISADGFAPDSTVVFRLDSVPRIIGSGVTDSAGAVGTAAFLPSDVPVGTHHVRVIGSDPTGQPVVESFAVRVVPPHSALALAVALIGLVAIVVGVLGFRTVRRARR